MNWAWRRCLNLSFVFIPAALPATGGVVREQGPKLALILQMCNRASPVVAGREVNDLEIPGLTTEFNLAGHYPGPLQRDPETPSITVRAYNLADAPIKDLVQASYSLWEIFMQAGIKIRWLSCALSLQAARTNRACEEATGRYDFDVVVSTSMITGPGVATDTSLGFSSPLVRGNHAVVLWDRSKKMAESSGVPARIILGHAMAHELGHLLLHSMEHSRMGIMRSRWGKEDLLRAESGSLLFTTEQAEVMRVLDWPDNLPKTE
jgi:hypothetical protein